MSRFGGQLNKTKLHKLADVPTVPVAQLYKHVINNNRPIILFDLADTHLDPIFSHKDLHYGYRIADTHRIRDILLLLFLVPTCHLSVLTFLIRFFVTYYCG